MSYADVNPLGVESINISGDRLIITNLGRQNPKETLLSYDPVDKDENNLVAEDLGKDDLEEQAPNENPDELEVPDASEDSKK